MSTIYLRMDGRQPSSPSSTLNHTILLLRIKHTKQIDIAVPILQWISSKYGEAAAKAIRGHVIAMSDKRQAVVALFKLGDEDKVSFESIIDAYTTYFAYLDAFIERLNKITNFQRVDGCTRCHNVLAGSGCPHSVPPEKGLLSTLSIQWFHTFDDSKAFSISEFLQERVYMLLNLPTLSIKFGRTVRSGTNRAERYALCCSDFRRAAGLFAQLENYITSHRIAESCKQCAPEVNLEVLRKANALMIAQANESFYYASRNDLDGCDSDTLASLANNVAQLFLQVYQKASESTDITSYSGRKAESEYDGEEEEDDDSSEEEDDEDEIRNQVMREMSKKAEQPTIPAMWRCFGLMMYYYYQMVAVWHHCEARNTDHGYCVAQFRYALKTYEHQCKMLSNPPKKKRLPADDIAFIKEISKFFNKELVAFTRYLKNLDEYVSLLPLSSVVIPRIITKDSQVDADLDVYESSSPSDIPPANIPEIREMQLGGTFSCEALFTSCSRTETQFPDWSSTVLQPQPVLGNTKPASSSSSSSKPRPLSDEEKHSQRMDLWLKFDDCTIKLTDRWNAILDTMLQFFEQNPWAIFYMLLYSKSELHLDFAQSFVGSRVSTIAADIRQYSNRLQDDASAYFAYEQIDNGRMRTCMAKYELNRTRATARQKSLQGLFAQIQAQLNFISTSTTADLKTMLFSARDDDLFESAPNATATLRKIEEMHRPAYRLVVEDFGRNMTAITNDAQTLTANFVNQCREYESIWRLYVSASTKKACSMEDMVKERYFEPLNRRMTEISERFRKESQKMCTRAVDALSHTLTDPNDATRDLSNIECQAFTVFLSSAAFEPDRRKLLSRLYVVLEKLKWINSQLELCQYTYDVQKRNQQSIIENYRQKSKPQRATSSFVPAGFSTIPLQPQNHDVAPDDDNIDDDLELYPPLDSPKIN